MDVKRLANQLQPSIPSIVVTFRGLTVAKELQLQMEAHGSQFISHVVAVCYVV
jgi:hypothetical protein